MLKVQRPYEIRVVLVRTIYERNVGATSRAMSNMGSTKLILIDPKCEITFEAQQAAANGQEGLQNRKVYSTWEEFYNSEPEGLRIAFTARDGKGRQVRDFPTELKEIAENSPLMNGEDDSILPVYLVFGPEDWGLSAADISLMNYCCTIPIYGTNTSLNLAQATLLALFIIRQEWGGDRAELEGQQKPRKPLQSPTVFPDQTLKQWVTEMGFDLSKRKMNVYTVLRRMLLQNTPTKKELVILETVLQQSIRKLREYNEMRKKN